MAGNKRRFGVAATPVPPVGLALGTAPPIRAGAGSLRAAPSAAVPNQAALTRLDFQHIKQVGLSIEVTPSGSRPRQPRAEARALGEKGTPWARGWGWAGGAEGLGGSVPAAGAPFPLGTGVWEPLGVIWGRSGFSRPYCDPIETPKVWFSSSSSAQCGVEGRVEHFGLPLLRVVATPRPLRACVAPRAPKSGCWQKWGDF